MKTIIQKFLIILQIKPSNAFLLFATGFFISQFILINILYSKHPFGGWETSIGSITNHSIFIVLLLVVSVCLIALWRTLSSTNNNKTVNASRVTAQLGSA